ncbi:MAG: PD-(D/E)XK nuclease family transposase [Bulleidia sp.]
MIRKSKRLNSESTSINEGTIYYDIRFQATVPGKEKPIGLIINIEMQRSDKPGDAIPPRAEYYCSRMISEQYGTVFTEGRYGDLQKVYSIWICPDPAQKRENVIIRFRTHQEIEFGHSSFTEADYDKKESVILFVGKNGDPNNQILDLLYTVFSDKMTTEEKKRRLSSTYGIEMTRKLENEVQEMCNLSKGIADVNREIGIDIGTVGHIVL